MLKPIRDYGGRQVPPDECFREIKEDADRRAIRDRAFVELDRARQAFEDARVATLASSPGRVFQCVGADGFRYFATREPEPEPVNVLWCFVPNEEDPSSTCAVEAAILTAGFPSLEEVLERWRRFEASAPLAWEVWGPGGVAAQWTCWLLRTTSDPEQVRVADPCRSMDGSGYEVYVGEEGMVVYRVLSGAKERLSAEEELAAE